MGITYTLINGQTLQSPKNNHVRWPDGATRYQLSGADEVVRDDGDIGQLIAYMNDSIKAKNAELLAEGFDYGGNTFSASYESQAEWEALKNRYNEGKLTGPIIVFDMTDTPVTVDDAAEIVAIYDAGYDYKMAVVNHGGQLMGQAAQATTIAEIEAVGTANAARQKADYYD